MFFILAPAAVLLLAPAAVLLLAAITGWVRRLARIRLQRECRGAPLFGEPRTLTSVSEA